MNPSEPCPRRVAGQCGIKELQCSECLRAFFNHHLETNACQVNETSTQTRRVLKFETQQRTRTSQRCLLDHQRRKGGTKWIRVKKREKVKASASQTLSHAERLMSDYSCGLALSGHRKFKSTDNVCNCACRPCCAMHE